MLDTIHIDNETGPSYTQAIPLAPVVRDVLNQFDPRTVDSYTVQIQVPEPLSVEADPQHLRQVLRNLLSNAFKYAPAQTQLVVSAQQDAASTAEGSAREVRISVRDQGPGITSADMNLLFKKFTRLERDLSGSVRGTGLGLYISKQLVEAMGGRIWVESSGIPGEGSNFCFTLPTTNDEKKDGTPLSLPQLPANSRSKATPDSK